MQRDSQLRTSRIVTRDIVRIKADVWSIPRFSRSGHIAHHAFRPNSQAVAGAIHRASMYTRQNHGASTFIVKINAGLEIAKRYSNIIHNFVDELFQIEDRANLLGGPMELKEAVNVLDLRRISSRIRNGNCGSCRHRLAPVSDNNLHNWIVRSAFKTLFL